MRESPLRATQYGGERKGYRSDSAEHVIVRAHVVIIHKQLASVGLIIKIICEAAHHRFDVVAFLDDEPGEVFFAVPLAAVGFLEVVEFVVELHVVINGLQTVLVAHIRVFEDMCEVVFRHEALVVPLAGGIPRSPVPLAPGLPPRRGLHCRSQ